VGKVNPSGIGVFMLSFCRFIALKLAYLFK